MLQPGENVVFYPKPPLEARLSLVQWGLSLNGERDSNGV